MVLARIGFLLLLFQSVLAFQGDELLESLEPRGYVNDYAGVISPEQETRLGSLLQELDNKSGAQIAVVSLPSLQGGEIQDFSNRLFERWGIGQRGEDNGILILAAIEDRRIRVEVGYGLEPLLPDSRVGRILDQVVMPDFRQGDYGSGLVSGAIAFASIIAADAGVELTGQVPRTQEFKGRPLTCSEMVIGIILLIILIPILVKHPWLIFFLLSSGRGGFSGGGFGQGGGFGGFGGGLSGGGGAGRSW